MLRENNFNIDRPYGGRAASITLGSLPNSIIAWWEKSIYCRKIRNTKVDPPLFILGIWRSGTTLLHNLLAQDDRLDFPNNYQVAYPHTFLSTEKPNARWIGAFLPKKRPQDNMTIGMDEPQEDEFALGALIGRSCPMAWAFPRQAQLYDRYLTLRTLSEKELAEWKAALTGYVQKLAFKYRRPLVLKSPGHTGRIKVLLELFPNAKFVHIYRNPYVVFQSIMHTMQAVAPWVALQQSNHKNLEDRTINQYKEVYGAFFEERGLIPKGHLHDLCFEELEKNPIGQIRNLYQSLDLPDFEYVESKLLQYTESLSGYKKNRFPEISEELWRRIAQE